MKAIIVKGVAGFGNRIQTVAGAIIYAEKTNRRLYVDWSDGLYDKKGKNVFSEIFQPINDEYISNPKELNEHDVYPKIFRERLFDRAYDLVQTINIGTYIGLVFLRKLFKKIFGENFWIQKNKEFKWIEFFDSRYVFPYGKMSPIGRKERTLVYIDYLSIAPLDVFWRYFSFSEAYLKEWHNHTPFNGLNWAWGIGIHIRATDIEEKGLDYEQICKALKQNLESNAFIYLATDNSLVSKTFQVQVGNSLIDNGWKLPNTKGKGLHHFMKVENEKDKINSMKALVYDILSLSYTEKFYPFKGSTLSDFIISYRKHLGKKPYEYYWNEEGSPLYIKSNH